MVIGPATASPLPNITLALFRHGEAASNATGVIDTSVPGPDLDATGRCQAASVAKVFSINKFDAIFASSMVRTQETAKPIAQALSEQVSVLPGLREIEAGKYEGQPSSTAFDTMMTAPHRWLQGDRSARIPGSVDGNEFNARFSDAVKHIYDSGANKPIVFSHSEAIMLWSLMNAHNADTSLFDSKPLPNVGHVTLLGNPTDGWKITEWDVDQSQC